MKKSKNENGDGLSSQKVDAVRQDAIHYSNASGGIVTERQILYLLLKERHGYTPDEIADYFDVSSGSVYKTIIKTQDKVRSMIEFVEIVKGYPDWVK